MSELGICRRRDSCCSSSERATQVLSACLPLPSVEEGGNSPLVSCLENSLWLFSRGKGDLHQPQILARMRSPLDSIQREALASNMRIT